LHQEIIERIILRVVEIVLQNGASTACHRFDRLEVVVVGEGDSRNGSFFTAWTGFRPDWWNFWGFPKSWSGIMGFLVVSPTYFIARSM
jgi:hypothetical protein